MRRLMFPFFALVLWVSSPGAGADHTTPEIQEPRDGEQTIVFCPHFAWNSPAVE